MISNFHVPIDHLYVFFGKMSTQILTHFSVKLFCFFTVVCVLRIFQTVTSYQICGLMIFLLFPQFASSFLISLAEHKISSLMVSYFFIFAFAAKFKNSLHKLMLRNLLPMFPSRSFTISGHTFKSLIHCEQIFVFRVRQGSDSFLLYVAVQLSQHHLLKRLSFTHSIFLDPLQKPLTIQAWVISGQSICARDRQRQQWLAYSNVPSWQLSLSFESIFFFKCGYTRSQLWHVGSSSLTKDGTQAPCIGGAILTTRPPGKSQKLNV